LWGTLPATDFEEPFSGVLAAYVPRAPRLCVDLAPPPYDQAFRLFFEQA
jgi:hypothetical protein